MALLPRVPGQAPVEKMLIGIDMPALADSGRRIATAIQTVDLYFKKVLLRACALLECAGPALPDRRTPKGDAFGIPKKRSIIVYVPSLLSESQRRIADEMIISMPS